MSEISEPTAIAELEGLSGSGFRRTDPAGVWAGSSFGYELGPESAEKLSEVMKILSAHAEPVLVTGGTTQLGSINAVRETQIRLSSHLLSGVDECDAADGVMLARAGTSIQELTRVAADAGWVWPMDTLSEAGTLGGALATGIEGPRRLGFGAVRDNVLGIETTLATGERTHCGARVVKNVTGYDMAKLYIGSFGSLAVIEGAWIRLKPKAESVNSMALSLEENEESFGLAIAASRRTSTRAVALLSESLASLSPELGPQPKRGAPWRLMVECGGDEVVTRHDSEWLSEKATSQTVSSEALDALGGLQQFPQAEGLRVRLHLLPSGLETACRELREAGLGVLAYPEPTTVYAFFCADSDSDPDWLPTALAVVEGVASRVRANWVIESLPRSGYQGRDLFRASETLPLMHALKEQFDPKNILNRGCFAGNL